MGTARTPTSDLQVMGLALCALSYGALTGGGGCAPPSHTSTTWYANYYTNLPYIEPGWYRSSDQCLIRTLLYH